MRPTDRSIFAPPRLRPAGAPRAAALCGALALSLAPACRATVPDGGKAGEFTAEPPDDTGEGGLDTGDTGEDDGLIIAPPVVYDCAALPMGPFTPTPMASARAYHGIVFDDLGHLIGWDSRSALVAATYSGERDVFVPGIEPVEQFDRLPDGDFVIGAPSSSTLLRVSPEGAVSTLFTGVNVFGGVYGVTVGPDGNVYTADGGVQRHDLTTGETTTLLAPPATGEWIAHAINFNLDSTMLYIGTIGSGQLLGLPLDADLNPTGPPIVLAIVGAGWHDAVEVDACGHIWVPDFYSSGFYRISGDDYSVSVGAEPTARGYGHGNTFGTGINGWRRDAIYQPQPYNGSTVREIVIGVPTGDTVRTWRGAPAPY